MKARGVPLARMAPPVIETERGIRIPAGTRDTLLRAFPGVAAAWRMNPVAEELTVRFVSDATIRELNRRFKRRDRPTDVLAFATGDVVVSAETAALQAADQAHSLRRELVHLAVHGLLHLGGWNDDTPRRRALMERRTVYILDAARVA